MTSNSLSMFRRWFSGSPKDDEQRATMCWLPKDVPENVHEAHSQACFLIEHSPRASGALSRYCLQQIIRDFWQIPPEEQGTLASEIDRISGRICAETRMSFDCVRNYGAIDSQFSQDRDMMVETTVEEAKILIALFQLLTREWYAERRKRRTHLDAIRVMIEKAHATSRSSMSMKPVNGSKNISTEKEKDVPPDVHLTPAKPSSEDAAQTNSPVTESAASKLVADESKE